MTMRVAINGFGRIGRQVFKTLWNEHAGDVEVVAIGLSETDDAHLGAAAHLLKFDSNYGMFAPTVRVADSTLAVGDRAIPLVAAGSPDELPWGKLGIDIVVEATGVFTMKHEAGRHLAAGAKRVVITAPSEDADFTMIYGVNEGEYDAAKHHIVSAGSDTSNCLAPLVKTLQQSFTVRNAMVTAVRAYTNSQKLLDLPDPDLRRARAAPQSIVPATTRAPLVVSNLLGELQGHLAGYAVCVPVSTVSILELTAAFNEAVSADAINAAFRAAAEGPLGRVMAVADAQLVSTDYKGSRFSAVVDAPLTITIGPLAKISAWYDNEWGYSCRVRDLIKYIAEKGI